MKNAELLIEKLIIPAANEAWNILPKIWHPKNTGSKYFILVLIKSLNLKLSILNLHNSEINLMVAV